MSAKTFSRIQKGQEWPSRHIHGVSIYGSRFVWITREQGFQATDLDHKVIDGTDARGSGAYPRGESDADLTYCPSLSVFTITCTPPFSGVSTFLKRPEMIGSDDADFMD